MAQRAGGDPPALVELADQVLGRDRHVVEEHLVEVEVVGRHDRPERAPGQAGAVGRDHQHAQAAVLGGVGVGADEGQDHVGVVRARRPHLLAVDDEPVAVEHGPGAQAGQVGARVRLAHPERGGDLAPQDRPRPALLLLLGAEGQDRRGDDAHALRVVARVDAAAAQLLLVHELLDQAGVAAPVLGRVARHQPPGVEQLPLPLPGPVRDVGRRAAPARPGRWPRPGRSRPARRPGRDGTPRWPRRGSAAWTRRPGPARGRGSAGRRGPGARRSSPAAARRPWPAARRSGGRSPRCSRGRRTAGRRAGPPGAGTRPRPPWPATRPGPGARRPGPRRAPRAGTAPGPARWRRTCRRPCA